MSSYPLTVQEAALLHQAAGMAGDRLARQENDAGVRSMETLLAQLQEEKPQDERSALAEELAERLFQDGEGEDA